MQFEFTEEQRLIQNMAAEFFDANGSSEAVRAALHASAGYDETVWQQMAQELGFAGLLINPEYGGQGLGLIEASIVFEEMGRRLVPSPLLGSGVLAAVAIDRAGTVDQKRRLLTPIAAGSCKSTLAVCEAGGNQASVGVNALVTSGGGGYHLNGEYRFVLDAAGADLLLLAGRLDGEVVIAAVTLPCEGLTVEPHTSLDLTRPYNTITAESVFVDEQNLLRCGGAAGVDEALAKACLVIAAEQAGAAATALSATVEYAGERQQFGRAIGSFQAVKHRLADMMVNVEAAISAVYYAACSADEDDHTLQQMASLAKVQASETLSFCAANMIQLHGGIGFTWEHDAHLFFKRARASSNWFGNVAVHQERIAISMDLDSLPEGAA